MMDIKIVSASKKDERQLLEFFKHYKIKSVIKKRVNCYLSHNFTVIAKDKNKIVGILQWYIKEDPRMGVAELEEFYVLENYRGKGIGSLLIRRAIRLVKTCFTKNQIKPRKIFIFTNENNKIARALLEKHGFKFVSKIGNLFSDNETEVFYCLNLN